MHHNFSVESSIIIRVRVRVNHNPVTDSLRIDAPSTLSRIINHNSVSVTTFNFYLQIKLILTTFNVSTLLTYQTDIGVQLSAITNAITLLLTCHGIGTYVELTAVSSSNIW